MKKKITPISVDQKIYLNIAHIIKNNSRQLRISLISPNNVLLMCMCNTKAILKRVTPPLGLIILILSWVNSGNIRSNFSYIININTNVYA